LAAVYGTINSHKGAIDFTSITNEGSTFRLFFPLVKDPEFDTGSNCKNEESVVRGSAHILLVDDEKMIRKPWVLVTGCLGWYLIHGWLWGFEAKEKDEEGKDKWGAFLDSKSPAWGVPQEHLHPMETLPDEPAHEVGVEVKEEDIS